MSAIGEEKCSPLKAVRSEQEAISTKGAEEVKLKTTVGKDVLLDEVAAISSKVEGMNLRQDTYVQTTPLELTKEDYVLKVREQTEVIDNLIRQMRGMYDEYNQACKEREYYSELCETLLQCLEMEELRRKGILQLDDKEDTNEAPEDSNASSNSNAAGTDANVGACAATESSSKNEQPFTSLNGDVQTEVKKSDLLRLNYVLLREIYSLRHQIDDIKENMRELLYEDSSSDEDSDYSEEGEEEEICITQEDYQQVVKNGQKNDDQ